MTKRDTKSLERLLDEEAERHRLEELSEAAATLEAMMVSPSWFIDIVDEEHYPKGSEVAATPAALAEAHENIYDFAAYDPEELKRRRLRSVCIQEFHALRKAEDSEPKLAMGLRSGDETSPKFWRIAEGNDKIKARGDRHRADFTWVGKGLEAEGVLLFVDGIRIEDVEVDLRADINAMRIFFMLPDRIGDDVPLDRAETCLEDDGSVRIQLWTKK